ncbi:lysine-rich coiled-coil protein 1 isoform X1 [Bufo bufo]|uniref:lysine-rich coiled-coil protein 1 isoform X1 n=1 Tax=Bufo bufo TaxID=8384 RepID=UPI001ABE2CBD|nr:lysine-rich coiled-coil protein 1 isoform X1 [Bufo bufo]
MASEGAIIPQLVESITQSGSPSTTCSVPTAGGDISSSAHTTIPCQTEIVLDEKTKKELFTDTFCRVCGAVLQFEAHRNAHYEGKRHAQKVRLYFLKQELEELTYKKKQKVEHVDFHVEKGISLDKNRFCSLCNMVFSSPVVAQSHYVGKIHAKKLKQMSGEQSEWSTGPEENAQVETAVDESDPIFSPLTEKSNQQDASSDPSGGDNSIDLSDPNKYCKLCCASFNKPLVAQQHYSGKKHARNKARQKMMEEMGDTGVPIDSGAGEGIYVCPICNITLTSIEMYQSHMQGNKHHIKETMVANVLKTTKKAYNSFQDELADYIKVQKARGLEPKKFRQDKDHSDSCEEEEPVPAPTHPKTSLPVPYKYPHHPPMPYPPYNSHHPPDLRAAGWDKPYWPQKPTPKIPSRPIPNRKHPRSSPDSSEDSSSNESSSSSKKEKRHKREHRSKDRKHQHSKTRRENGSSERKKRKIEDSDSGKDDGEREKKAEESKHRKDKKKREEPAADKEGKKHKKTKKIEDQRTEEEMLWDESILGF